MKIIVYLNRNFYNLDKQVIEEQIRNDPTYTGFSILYAPTDGNTQITTLWEPQPFSSFSSLNEGNLIYD